MRKADEALDIFAAEVRRAYNDRPRRASRRPRQELFRLATQPDIAVTAERPAGWFDKTMIIYSGPPAPGRPLQPNIVVSRDAVLAGESFREYCNRQIAGFNGSLPGFAREEEGPGRVHDHDAFQILFTWDSGAGKLRQRVFFIAAGGGVAVTFATTAAADEYHEHAQAFERGLAGLRIEPVRTH